MSTMQDMSPEQEKMFRDVNRPELAPVIEDVVAPRLRRLEVGLESLEARIGPLPEDKAAPQPHENVVHVDFEQRELLGTARSSVDQQAQPGMPIEQKPAADPTSDHLNYIYDEINRYRAA